MKKINLLVFLVTTVLYWFLIFATFICAFAEDEGTLGNSFFLLVAAKLFYVFSFPTLYFFGSKITGAAMYFGALCINGMFYGVISERLFFVIDRIRK